MPSRRSRRRAATSPRPSPSHRARASASRRRPPSAPASTTCGACPVTSRTGPTPPRRPERGLLHHDPAERLDPERRAGAAPTSPSSTIRGCRSGGGRPTGRPTPRPLARRHARLGHQRARAVGFNLAPRSGFQAHELDGTRRRHLEHRRHADRLPRLPDAGERQRADRRLSRPPRDARPHGYGGPSTNGTLLDGVVQEVAPDGTVVWSWSTEDHIDPSETPERWRPSSCTGCRTSYRTVGRPSTGTI